MSTEREPLPEEKQTRRALQLRQRLFLAAFALLASGMIAELILTHRIRPFWNVLVLVALAAYYWRARRDQQGERAVRTLGRAKTRPRTGRGQKPMIAFAAVLLVAFAVVNELQAAGERGPLWRVFLAIAGFLYLWWLSSLLFDLAFVWHRYIQGDAAHRFLREKVQRKNFDPRNDSPEEPPSPLPADLPPFAPPGGTPTHRRSPESRV